MCVSSLLPDNEGSGQVECRRCQDTPARHRLPAKREIEELALRDQTTSRAAAALPSDDRSTVSGTKSRSIRLVDVEMDLRRILRPRPDEHPVERDGSGTCSGPHIQEVAIGQA